MFSKQNGLVPRERFITAMRGVASSVTVVTTAGAAGRHGATVSAFSSVSADPPTVLICLFAESRIARVLQENGRFCVNVLPETAHEVADRFAGRHDTRVADRFCGIACHGSPDAPPVLAGATGFSCTVQQCVRSGSHLIVIGHVLDVSGGEGRPLAWREGSYHRVVPQNMTPRAAAV